MKTPVAMYRGGRRIVHGFDYRSPQGPRAWSVAQWRGEFSAILEHGRGRVVVERAGRGRPGRETCAYDEHGRPMLEAYASIRLTRRRLTTVSHGTTNARPRDSSAAAAAETCGRPSAEMEE